MSGSHVSGSHVSGSRAGEVGAGRSPKSSSGSRNPKRKPRRGGCLGPLALGAALGVALPLLALTWLQSVDTIGPAPLLIAYAALPWLLPVAGLVMIGLALVSRSGLVWILALVLGGIYGLRYGRVWLPADDEEPPVGKPLRVMTFNIGDGRVSAEDVMAWVRTEDPDVVAIQELNPYTAAALNQGLAAGWPHQALDFYSPTTGLFSRYPLTSAEFVETPNNRPYLRADLDAGGVPVHVFAMHPQSPDIVFRRGLPIGINDERARAQLVSASEIVRATTGPRLMLGDFNMSDQSPGYRTITRGLRDAFAEVGFGPGFTWPAAHSNRLRGWAPPVPLVRIDYILHSDEFSAVSARVNCELSSDHCYIVADLILK